MQTSLRSNYPYYDYGTLDCTTRHIAHLQDHDHSSDHIQLPAQQLQQHQQSDTPHHELIQQQQAIIGDSPFDQQEPVASESSSCFALIEPQNNETAHQSNNNQIEGQLVVYEQQNQYHHLLSSSNHLHLQHHHHHHHQQQQHIHNLDSSGQNEEVEGIYNQHQTNQHLIHHHPQQPVLATDSADNGPSQEQQQQQESQTTTAYPTIYYEPINFTESCAIEQHHTLNEPPQTFTSHLLDVSQFVSLQPQQPGVSTEEGSCTYFQYQHDVVDEQQVAEQHRKETPLLDNQENQNYGDHQLACEQQNQIYQTLEISGNHSFGSDQHNQVLSHSYQQSLEAVDLGSVIDQQQQQQQQQPQQDYQQQELKKLTGYQLNNCYINSDSTRSQNSPACSTSSSEESSNSTLTRDEKRAREANIPLTYQEIVNLTIDQFNEQLAKHHLTESQLTLIKDIRRRGKNKVAAQSCRKRKMEQIYELQQEVYHLAVKKRSLNSECNQLMREHSNLVQKYNKIYPIIHCFNKDTWNS